MSNPVTDLAVGWSAERLPLGSHVCCYYADEATLRRTLAFLRVGLDAPGELCIVFADEGRHRQLLEWLRTEDGVASHGPDRHVDSGKLVFVGGAPDGAALAANIVRALDTGIAAGYSAIRLLGFIAWGTPGWPDDAALLEFEDAVNEVVAAYPAVVICTYGVPSLTGPELIYGGLGTHPIVVIGDTTLSPNSLYRFHRKQPPGATEPAVSA